MQGMNSTSQKATDKQRDYIVALYNQANGTDHTAVCDCEGLGLSWLAAVKMTKTAASKIISDLSAA